jgi:hypothetical protein
MNFNEAVAFLKATYDDPGICEVVEKATQGAADQKCATCGTCEGRGYTAVASSRGEDEQEPCGECNRPEPSEAAAVEPAKANPDLVRQFENAVNACTHYHTEYTGKEMPDGIYDRFVTLRDETIPRLRAGLLDALVPMTAEPVTEIPVSGPAAPQATPVAAQPAGLTADELVTLAEQHGAEVGRHEGATYWIKLQPRAIEALAAAMTAPAAEPVQPTREEVEAEDVSDLDPAPLLAKMTAMRATMAAEPVERAELKQAFNLAYDAYSTPRDKYEDDNDYIIFLRTKITACFSILQSLVYPK